MAADDSIRDYAAFNQIGLYIYWFSRLENAVRVAMTRMLALNDHQSSRLLPLLDFASVCRICKAEIDINRGENSDHREILKDLINKALKTIEDRNRIAHGYWFYGDEDTPVAIHSSRTTLQDTVYFGRPGELVDKANELRQLSKQIWDYMVVNCEPNVESQPSSVGDGS